MEQTESITQLVNEVFGDGNHTFAERLEKIRDDMETARNSSSHYRMIRHLNNSEVLIIAEIKEAKQSAPIDPALVKRLEEIHHNIVKARTVESRSTMNQYLKTAESLIDDEMKKTENESVDRN